MKNNDQPIELQPIQYKIQDNQDKHQTTNNNISDNNLPDNEIIYS